MHHKRGGGHSTFIVVAAELHQPHELAESLLSPHSIKSVFHEPIHVWSTRTESTDCSKKRHTWR
eukprot:1571478-Amphidinium_carterae.1